MAKKILVILKEVAIGLCVTAAAVASAVGWSVFVKHKNSGQNSCIRRNSGDKGSMIGNVSLPLYAEEIDMTGKRINRDKIENTFLKKCIECSPGWQGNTNICGFAALSFIANMEGKRVPVKGLQALNDHAFAGLVMIERDPRGIQDGIEGTHFQNFLNNLFLIRKEVRDVTTDLVEAGSQDGRIYLERVGQGKLWADPEKLYEQVCNDLESNYVIIKKGVHFSVVAGTFLDKDGKTKIIHYQPMDTCTDSCILIRNKDEFKETYLTSGLEKQRINEMYLVKKNK